MMPPPFHPTSPAPPPLAPVMVTDAVEYVATMVEPVSTVPTSPPALVSNTVDFGRSGSRVYGPPLPPPSRSLAPAFARPAAMRSWRFLSYTNGISAYATTFFSLSYVPILSSSYQSRTQVV